MAPETRWTETLKNHANLREIGCRVPHGSTESVNYRLNLLCDLWVSRSMPSANWTVTPIQYRRLSRTRRTNERSLVQCWQLPTCSEFPVYVELRRNYNGRVNMRCSRLQPPTGCPWVDSMRRCSVLSRSLTPWGLSSNLVAAWFIVNIITIHHRCHSTDLCSLIHNRIHFFRSFTMNACLGLDHVCCLHVNQSTFLTSIKSK